MYRRVVELLLWVLVASSGYVLASSSAQPPNQQLQYQQQMFNAMKMNQMMNPIMSPGIAVGRARLPKLIPSINSMASRFRQHLVQTFRPLASASRWPMMLGQAPDYTSYPKQFAQYAQPTQTQMVLQSSPHFVNELDNVASQTRSFEQSFATNSELLATSNDLANLPNQAQFEQPGKFVRHNQFIFNSASDQQQQSAQPSTVLELPSGQGSLVDHDGQMVFASQGGLKVTSDTAIDNQLGSQNFNELHLNGTHNTTLEEGQPAEMFEQQEFLEQNPQHFQNMTDQSEGILDNSSQIIYQQQVISELEPQPARKKTIPLHNVMTDMSNNLVTSDGTYIQGDRVQSGEAAATVYIPNGMDLAVPVEQQMRSHTPKMEMANMTVHHHHMIASGTHDIETVQAQNAGEELVAANLPEELKIRSEQVQMAAAAVGVSNSSVSDTAQQESSDVIYEAEKVPCDPEQAQTTMEKENVLTSVSVRVPQDPIQETNRPPKSFGRPRMFRPAQINRSAHRASTPSSHSTNLNPDKRTATKQRSRWQSSSTRADTELPPAEQKMDHQVIKAGASSSVEFQSQLEPTSDHNSVFVQLSDDAVIQQHNESNSPNAQPSIYVSLQPDSGSSLVKEQTRDEEIQTVMKLPTSSKARQPTPAKVVTEHVYMVMKPVVEYPAHHSNNPVVTNDAEMYHQQQVDASAGNERADQQYIVVDQPVLVSNSQLESSVESNAHLSPTHKKSAMNDTINVESVNQEPVVYVSAKPKRVYQQTQRRPTKSDQARQRQKEKVSLDHGLRDQRASEQNAVHVVGTLTTTSKPQISSASLLAASSRLSEFPSRAGRKQSQHQSVSRRDETSKSKAKVRWQGIGISGNRNHTDISQSETSRTEQAWLVGGMTHQAYASQPAPSHSSLNVSTSLAANLNNNRNSSDSLANHKLAETSSASQNVTSSDHMKDVSSNAPATDPTSSTTPAPAAPFSPQPTPQSRAEESSRRPSRNMTSEARALLKSFSQNLSNQKAGAPVNHRPVASEPRTATTSFRLSSSQLVAAALVPVDSDDLNTLSSEVDQVSLIPESIELPFNSTMSNDLNMTPSARSTYFDQLVPIGPFEEHYGDDLGQLDQPAERGQLGVLAARSPVKSTSSNIDSAGTSRSSRNS